MEEYVYKGNFLQVSEEEINGEIYERAYIRDAMTIFPFDNKGNILIIKENRVHEKPSIRWKPVTGFYEYEYDYSGNVNRELQEEIGFKARTITPYFEIKQTGTINITQYFAIATQLEPSKLPNPDGEESIMEIAAIPIDEALTRTLSGELVRGTAGYALLKLCIEIENGHLKLNL